MNDTPAETLYLDDRTDWSPQPRGRGDRRGMLTALAALGVFAALLAGAGRRDARASGRSTPARAFVVARITPPGVLRAPGRSTESAAEPRGDCSRPPPR